MSSESLLRKAQTDWAEAVARRDHCRVNFIARQVAIHSIIDDPERRVFSELEQARKDLADTAYRFASLCDKEIAHRDVLEGAQAIEAQRQRDYDRLTTTDQQAVDMFLAQRIRWADVGYDARFYLTEHYSDQVPQ